MTTVLIVDDDQQVRELLADLFGFEGFEVRLASDGFECLAGYQTHQPDVVIMDILMPDKEGIQTIIDLKEIDPDATVIAISGGGRIPAGEYLHTADRLGVAGSFEKPLDLDRLLALVRQVTASG